MKLLSEQQFEHLAHERLDEEKLGEICKREVEADELQPVREQRQHIKARIVRIVEERRDQAHRRAHQADGRADDRHFKQDRVRGARIKYARGKPERAGASHHDFQKVREAEFREHHRPNRHHPPAHIHAALRVDRAEYTVFAGNRHQRGAVHHIQAEKHIGVHGDDYREQRKDFALK